VPVRYTPPSAESLLAVPGVTLGAAAAKIKNWDRNDVLLVVCEPGTVAAGVFTQNRFCAAPVTVCRAHLARQHASGGGLRALIVNAGNANAGTGEAGLADAHAECVAVARLLTAALVGLGTPNPATYVIVPAALICLTMVASYFPARRASLVDPLRALRYE